MKKLAVLLSALLCLGLFAGCSQQPSNQNANSVVTPEQIWEQVEKAINPNGDALPAFMDEVPLDVLGQLYALTSDDIDSFVLKTPMMNVQATEIFIAKVKPGRMDAVREAVTARQKALDQTWSMYLPAQYELVQNYKTAEKGDFFLFVVAEDADGVVSAFESAIQ